VPDTSPPTHTLNIRDQHESEILEALVKTLRPEIIQPTPQEQQEMADMAVQRERSERDRVEVREKLLKERREEELLRIARGEAGVAA
jgi:large subunit ribosomal protein MRP49